ncbi:FecR family protein [Hyphomonas sp. CACIAM 19H1]|uniref:FecR family protein n=1 Tax=Hyphomonas sp. CACIAM 19H1 TaxID=1873716 RepID=UPI0013B04AD7|nr:FecR family protein [Hyphomonas sp. CACIAM 19H1]
MTEQMTDLRIDPSPAEREAARWLMLLAERRLDPAEAARFEAWLGAGPDHEAAFRRLEAAWCNLPHMSGVPELDALMRPSLYERVAGGFYSLTARLTRRRRAGGLMGGALALAAACLCFALLAPQADGPLPPQAPDYTTQIAELRDLILEDGSRVTLGAASALDVVFTPGERRVVLSRGEAFFEVTKDAGRPFIVETPDAVVRVLGTRFDVRLGSERVRVAVSEGKVEVLQPLVPSAPLKDEDVRHVLLAGQSVVTAKAGKVEPVLPVEAAEVAAWRDGQLVYVDAPLSEIIADINRYSRSEIVLADPALGEIRYTAAFNAAEAGSMLGMIRASLSLEEIHEGGRIILKAP